MPDVKIALLEFSSTRQLTQQPKGAQVRSRCMRVGPAYWPNR